jgi:hypothetical protein
MNGILILLPASLASARNNLPVISDVDGDKHTSSTFVSKSAHECGNVELRRSTSSTTCYTCAVGDEDISLDTSL